MLIHNYPLKYFFYTVLLNFTHSLLTTEVLKDALFQVILSCLFSRQIIFQISDDLSRGTGSILHMHGPSQWEMALHCNAISHWLGAYTEQSLEAHVNTSQCNWGEILSSSKGALWRSKILQNVFKPCICSDDIENARHAVSLSYFLGCLVLTHWPQGEVAVILN